MRISEIPQEVYAVALDYEGITRPENMKDCEFWYVCETRRRMFTDGGLEKAICEYLTSSGAFHPDTGEFAGYDSYILDFSDARCASVL